jgi:hypothetical protein
MPVSYINRADCLNDDFISFPLTLTNQANTTLEVWAGTGACDMTTRTTTSSTTCWLIYSQPAVMPIISLNLRVWDILYGTRTGVTSGSGGAAGTAGVAGTAGAGTGGTAGNAGTAGTGGAGTGGSAGTTTGLVSAGTLVGPFADITVCDPAGTGLTTAHDIVVYFMLISSGEMAVGQLTPPWKGSYKLIAPPPPALSQPGIGENELVVNFDPTATNQDSTNSGFNVYCDPPRSGGGSVDGGVQSCSSTTSTTLVEGQDPPAGSQCGTSAQGSSTITASGLTNGVAYSVAVAATDRYFNVGKLSNVECQTPQPITSFYEAYRNAGGTGGGGFCSISQRRAGLPLLLFSLIGLAAMLRRRAR